MKKPSLLMISVTLLSIILIFGSIPFVSAREELHENEVWISGFEDPVGTQWNPIEVGDDTDVSSFIDENAASYNILGFNGTYNLGASLDNDTWIAGNNSAFPYLPDDYNVTEEGFWVSHLWGDTFGVRADQSPSVHFDYNVSLPVNMSDYTITSASISAIVNATVHANAGSTGGVDVPGDTTSYAALNDYVRFYLLLSDLPKAKVYEVAYNQSYDLGKDSAGTMDQLNDTYMIPVSEENLIFFLTSVLNTDNYNFTISVGFRIFCEDNFSNDQDYFDDLIIKNVSLSFTYQKKINQLTTLSWVGTGNSLNSTNVLIRDASFEFSYKIDTPWPTADSPNSEFRIFVSDKQISETIKLSGATSNYQQADPDGYNVTSLISLDENITVSIQVYIGDNFELNSPIAVSIDDVVLKITYVVIFQDPPPTNLRPYIYGSAGLLAALAAGIGFYEGIFKHPPMIRLIRKMKGRIRRGRNSNTLIMNDSNTIGRNIFEEEKRHLNKVSSKPQHSQPSKKAAPKKDASQYKDVSPPEETKITEKKIEGSEKNA